MAVRQAAVVSDENALEACACSRLCAIQIDDLYKEMGCAQHAAAVVVLAVTIAVVAAFVVVVVVVVLVFRTDWQLH